MKKHIGISLFFMGCFLSLSATNYFVATNGDDSNAGTLDKPFATLQKRSQKSFPEILRNDRRGIYANMTCIEISYGHSSYTIE